MNSIEYKNKLVRYILHTHFDDFSDEVKAQAVKCFLDLAGVFCAGSKNNTAKTMARFVSQNYPEGDYFVFANGKKTNLLGASIANGMAANALDMDDGYSLLRGHPGAGFFGALLSAAEHADITYGEFLCSLVIAYELSIRQGYSIRDYYHWDHSSGSYSAFATAAAVGKLLKLNERELNSALSISDFIAPLTPAKRSCYYPSMNKDGIYFGQYAGTQAVLMAKSGITGDNPVILDDQYLHYLDTLGEKFYFFDLYIKFYSCCRWAHAPIGALAGLMKKHGFAYDDVSKIDVFSFGNAGTLYRKAPACEDEAQYNIIYPIAAQLVFGNCGPLESSTDKMLDSRIEDAISKIEFHHDAAYDTYFPAKRLCRVEVMLKNGQKLVSPVTEPKGDFNAAVSIDDIKSKIYAINGIYSSVENIDTMLDAILNTSFDESFSIVFESIKNLAVDNLLNKHKHI